MAKFEATDGFIVKGWMRLHLGLAGGELFAYAIVYHFSQKSGAGVYIGGIPYIAAFIGCTQNTARTYLHNLTQRGLIVRIDATSNGIPFQHFKANPEFVPNIQDTPKKFEDTPKKFEGMDTPKKFEVESNSKKVNLYLPPTPQEVAAYVRTRGFADPEGFADLFIENCTNNGWRMHGGTGDPIVNWKNYIINSWERNHKTKTYPRALTPRKDTPVKWNEITY